jgi:hypothetical protein
MTLLGNMRIVVRPYGGCRAVLEIATRTVTILGGHFSVKKLGQFSAEINIK